MKVRMDYVSNSSSISYVVVLPRDYKFKQFVKDVVKGSVHATDAHRSHGGIDRLKELNARNLEYCLNTYVLLFLGTLTYEGRNGRVGERLAYEITVPWDVMRDIRLLSHMDSEVSKRLIVDSIIDCCERCDARFGCGRSKLYEITMDTILNTEALISEKQNLHLDGGCSDLGALKRIIEGGERIFGIEVNQGGDGESSTAIYALGGWGADAFRYANVPRLHFESM